MPRILLQRAISLGATFGFLGVAGGAFGAHALKAVLQPDMLQVFEVGIRYQLYHALALVAVGLVGRDMPRRPFEIAAAAYVLGILLFSGSLYMMALSGIRWIGAVTPLGGVSCLVGWASLAYGAWDRTRTSGAGPDG